MSDRQAELYNKAYALWQEGIEITDLRRKYESYRNADGFFATATKTPGLEPRDVGLVAVFRLDYARVLAQEFDNTREAERQYKASVQLANDAIRSDSHEVYARLVLFIVAASNMPNKPSFLSDVMAPGGGISKWFKAGFDQGDYKSSKAEAQRVLSDLASSFKSKRKEGMFIEDILDMSFRIMNTLDSMSNLELDFLFAYQSLVLEEEDVSRIKVLSVNEDQTEELIDQLAEAQDIIRSRVDALTI